MIFSPSGQEQAWAIVWKEDGSARFRDYLLSFGLSQSIDEALARVEKRLAADPFFRRDVAGGVFYAVAAHRGLPVQRG